MKFNMWDLVLEEVCNVLTIGNSKTVTKSGMLPSPLFISPAQVSKQNWLGGATYNDKFAVIQTGKKVVVKRLDRNHAWGNEFDV